MPAYPAASLLRNWAQVRTLNCSKARGDWLGDMTPDGDIDKSELAFVGDRLGIDLYLVALFAFGLRIFQNVALIRRHFL